MEPVTPTTEAAIEECGEQRRAIDTADHVHHEPTGEDWVVAYVRDDKLAWCGWPEGEADVADCTLIRKGTFDERRSLLIRLAAIGKHDARGRYACYVMAHESTAPQEALNQVADQHGATGQGS